MEFFKLMIETHLNLAVTIIWLGYALSLVKKQLFMRPGNK